MYVNDEKTKIPLILRRISIKCIAVPPRNSAHVNSLILLISNHIPEQFVLRKAIRKSISVNRDVISYSLLLLCPLHTYLIYA